MSPKPSASAVVGTLALLSLTGVLAGCAAAAAPADEPSSTGGGSSGDTSATYKDGEYKASGGYESPAGPQTIDVALTLAGDKVTAVTVTPHATDPNAARYQGFFVGGIKDVVVGKDIDSLKVSRVAGSSLTSGGFNEALKEIKADALG